MRAIRTSFTLAAALAILQACSPPSTPAPATAAATGAIRAASDAAARARAKQLVWIKFTDEDMNVGFVEIHATDKPRVYSYICDYDEDLPGQFCFYTAKGQVDLETEGVTVTSRRRGGCYPIDAQAQ